MIMNAPRDRGRTVITRLPEHASADRAALDRLLDLAVDGGRHIDAAQAAALAR